MVGQSFQEWLALTQAAGGLSEGNLSGVDISIPGSVELNVGAVNLEHRLGSGNSRADIPNVTVLGSLSLTGPRVCDMISGADGQSGNGHSSHHRVPCRQYASTESSIDRRGHSSMHSSPSIASDQLSRWS